MGIGEDLDRAIERRWVAAQAELVELCAQPSISAQGTGMQEMVRLVERALQRRGFDTRVVPTARHPAVMARRRGAKDRTLLFYNHYDVQPPEPLELWTSPPFQPTVRDGKLFARGVMDDKGHLACRLAAVDAVTDVLGELPCAVTFLVEGEEEIASPSLPTLVAEHRSELAADLCLWEFGDVDSSGCSVQYLGFRGILYVELSVKALARDCHSGVWGTVLPNAAWRLTWALSTLKSPDERVGIRGFYDRVVPPSDVDRQLMGRLPPISDEERSALGARTLICPPAPPEFYEHAVMTPSCTICGLSSGYQGEGQKTIMPARASAKVDFRLVPDQGPEEILEKLRTHLDAHGFQDVEVACIGKLEPARTPVDAPWVAMVVESAREVYGQPQRIHPMSGGSGPASLFRKHLGVPVVTAGVGYPGSAIHAPDEHIRLEDFKNGIRHTARILAEMGRA